MNFKKIAHTSFKHNIQKFEIIKAGIELDYK